VSDWQTIADNLPDKGSDVLVLWTYPDGDPIIRLGRFLLKSFARNVGDFPIFKIEVDYGDAGSWFYTTSDDIPTHWHSLPELPA